MCLGIITGVHGVRGQVRVRSFTADPVAIASYGPLTDERGERRFALELVASAKGVLIARIEGVADRDAAERLRGVRLYLDRKALPAPGAEEYYLADLVGLAASLNDGRALGVVAAVHDFGAGASIEIAAEDGAPLVVPFNTAAVPVVDIAGGRLVVTPPIGLLDRPTRAKEA